MQCTSCHGWGHMRKMCPSAVKYYPKTKAEAEAMRNSKKEAVMKKYNPVTRDFELLEDGEDWDDLNAQ